MRLCLHVCSGVLYCLPALPAASVYSCLYGKNVSLRRKVQSSEFKFRFHFDDAICLVKPVRGCGGNVADESKTTVYDLYESV